jgi:drug/metabolite transporter (DMT)-like permease
MTPNTTGAALMVAAMAAFAIEDALIKKMGGALPPGQIIALLGLIGACVMALAVKGRRLALFPPESLGAPVLLRNGAESFGTVCFVTAITKVDLAVASAILQATPLVVTLGAVVLFSEQVGWRRWTAMAVGFAGVLLIVRPGFAGFEPAALWAVGGMAALAVRDLATRRVAAEVHTFQLSFQAFALLFPTGLALSLTTGLAPMTAPLWGLMGLAAAIGIAAYWCIVQAMRSGDISFVTPFRYSRMIFALAIGMGVFGEMPDLWTWTGIALILGAGLYTFLRERRLARRLA